jgi:hypothetical protein
MTKIRERVDSDMTVQMIILFSIQETDEESA